MLSPQYLKPKKESSIDIPFKSPRRANEVKKVKDVIDERIPNRRISKYQGLSIDDFIIGKTLGQGRFGSAHLAIEKMTGAIFALKKVKK